MWHLVEGRPRAGMSRLPNASKQLIIAHGNGIAACVLGQQFGVSKSLAGCRRPSRGVFCRLGGHLGDSGWVKQSALKPFPLSCVR